MKLRALVLGLCLALLAGALIPVSAVESLPDDPMYWRATHPEEYQDAQDGSGVAASRREADSNTYKPRVLAEGETLRKGIDVSYYQGNIDWAQAAADGVEFAIVRVGYRGWGLPGNLAKDTAYVQNIQGAKKNGIKVGAYFYSQAITEEEGREEARYMMDLLQGYEMDLPLVIDYEYGYANGGSAGRLYNAKLTKDQATAVCNAFCDEVERKGYDSMVYANYSMLYSHLNRTELRRVWLAHYTVQTGYQGDYEFWQYSSTGSVKGISGNVDMDFWFDPGENKSTLPFRDVKYESWYYEDLKQAYESGIIKGTTEYTFSPENMVTRGQLVTMLYRMEGEPAVSGATTFQDLTQDYYKDAVLWAFQNGVVNGFSADSFGPEQDITREQLVTILYRKAGEPSYTGDLSRFDDAAKVSDYARDAVCWAVEIGLLKGYTEHEIGPQGTATRAQACAFLMRYRRLVDQDTKSGDAA